MKLFRLISNNYVIIFSTVLIFLVIYSFNVTSTLGFARSEADAQKLNSTKILSEIVGPGTDIVLSAVLDAQVHSDKACANFQATIGGTNAPWELRLDKFGGCDSSAAVALPPKSLVHWTVRIVADSTGFAGALCRPRNLSKPGMEECYGEFKLPSGAVLKKLLSDDADYVALLMAGLLEAAPITTTTSYNQPPGRRQFRFPGNLARSTTLQPYWIQFANDGDELILTPRNRSAPARKYFWGKKQGFVFRKDAFQTELLKPDISLATQSTTPAIEITPSQQPQESFVAEEEVRDPVLINIQLDPTYHSDTACGLLRDAFVTTSSPWGITPGKVVTCSAVSPAPVQSLNAHYWRFYISPREGRAHAALCRPTSPTGSEECYGHIHLVPEAKLQKALTQPEFVTLLTAAVLEAAPVSAYVVNGNSAPKRDKRLPQSLENPPKLVPVQFGYDQGGQRLKMSQMRSHANARAHYLAVSPPNSARGDTFQRAIEQALERIEIPKIAAEPASVSANLPATNVVIIPTATPVALAASPTGAPTATPTTAPTPSVAQNPVPTSTPLPKPTLPPTPTPMPPVPAPRPTTPPAPASAPPAPPAPAPASAPPAPASAPPAPAPAPPTQFAKKNSPASNTSRVEAPSILLTVSGLPVPASEQKRFSSVLSYGFDVKLWNHETTRFGLRATRARHTYSVLFTPDQTPIDDINAEETAVAQKNATAVRYENAVGLSVHHALVVAQRRLYLEMNVGEVAYTTQWSYDRTLTTKVFPALSNAAYTYGLRMFWVPWLQNSGDVMGLEAEWQKGLNLTGRVLGLHLGWRVSYHGNGDKTSEPDFLIDFFGKAQVGSYKTPNLLSGVQEDIKTNTILVGTTLSIM